LDVCSLTITNLGGRLRVAEEAFEELSPTLLQDGKLFLTEEDWNACRTPRDVENPGLGGSKGMGDSGGGNGGRDGGDHSRGRRHGNGGRGLQKTDECRRCGKLDHRARES
jgi:hypothetical protein